MIDSADNSHQTTNKHPWATITVGFLVLVVTTVFYNSTADEHFICHSNVDIFEMYGRAVVLFGVILTIWAYVKNKSFSKMWILVCVLAFNIFAVFYYGKLLKPLPSQLRFSLINKTHYDLSELRVIGEARDAQLQFDKLGKDKELNFIISDYIENSDIDLICKIGNNKTGTLNLAEGVTNSCGYYFKIDLVMKGGRLSKN